MPQRWKCSQKPTCYWMLLGSPLCSGKITVMFTDEARYQCHAQSRRRSMRLQQVMGTMDKWVQTIRPSDGTALQKKADLKSRNSTAPTTEVSAAERWASSIPSSTSPSGTKLSHVTLTQYTALHSRRLLISDLISLQTSERNTREDAIVDFHCITVRGWKEVGACCLISVANDPDDSKRLTKSTYPAFSHTPQFELALVTINRYA
jgi:hypothetical protein